MGGHSSYVRSYQLSSLETTLLGVDPCWEGGLAAVLPLYGAARATRQGNAAGKRRCLRFL